MTRLLNDNMFVHMRPLIYLPGFFNVPVSNSKLHTGNTASSISRHHPRVIMAPRTSTKKRKTVAENEDPETKSRFEKVKLESQIPTPQPEPKPRTSGRVRKPTAKMMPMTPSSESATIRNTPAESSKTRTAGFFGKAKCPTSSTKVKSSVSSSEEKAPAASSAVQKPAKSS